MRLLDLKIDSIECKNQKKHPSSYHAILPQHEFSMLIVAPKGSGKTNLLCNLILKHYKGYFHRVIVCSPTVNNDDKWDIVKKSKNVLAENTRKDIQSKLKTKCQKVVFHGKDSPEKKFEGIIPEEDFISSLDDLPIKLKEQNDDIKRLSKTHEHAKFSADRILIIMDDQSGNFKGGVNNNPMINFVARHRHYCASVIIVAQAYKTIPKTIRTNMNCLILFEIPNVKELGCIYEENPEGMRYADWQCLYTHATKEPFSFLYTNNKFPKGERVYKRFETMLTICNDIDASSLKRTASDNATPNKKAKLWRS